MKLAATIAAAAALSASSALAADLRIVPQAVAPQQIKYVSGNPATVSVGAHWLAIISVSGDRFDAASGPRLVLAVENHTSAPLNLTAAEMTIATDKGPVRILTVGDLEAQARGREKMRNFAARLSAAGAAMQTNHGGSFDATTTRIGSTAYTSGSYTAPTAGPNYGEIANNRDRALAQSSQTADYEREAAARTGFKPATVEAGAQYITSLPLDRLPRGAAHLKVTLRLGDEIHEFAYDVSPAR